MVACGGTGGDPAGHRPSLTRSTTITGDGKVGFTIDNAAGGDVGNAVAFGSTAFSGTVSSMAYEAVFRLRSGRVVPASAVLATGGYERKLATLARAPLLIIDDVGLKPLRAPADEDLHELIAERYEQTATIVTSNLDFDEWDQAFATNRLLAAATLDRLRHNAYCIELDGPSYRDPKVPPAHKKTASAKSINAAK